MRYRRPINETILSMSNIKKYIYINKLYLMLTKIWKDHHVSKIFPLSTLLLEYLIESTRLLDKLTSYLDLFKAVRESTELRQKTRFPAWQKSGSTVTLAKKQNKTYRSKSWTINASCRKILRGLRDDLPS